MPWALAILAAGWLSVSTTPAAPERGGELSLAWDAPQACPGREVVLERVEGLLGRSLRDAEASPVRVQARVEPVGEALRLSLRTETAEGRSDREMSGQTCEVLVDAAALVIAVALDPSLALGPEPEPEPEPQPLGDLPECIEPDAIEAQALEPAEPAPAPEPVAGTVRAAVTGSLGPLPLAAPGVEVVAGFVRRQARVELGFDYFFARRVAAASGDDRGGEIQLWTLAARGCWAPGVSILEFPVCGGVQAGPMRGEGYGLSTPTTTRLAWVAAEVGGALLIRGLPLVDVWAGADLVVPLTRPGFFIDDVGLVHRSGGVGGEASVGLEVRFGPGRALERRSR
ncbi:MAG: hypothetical protein KDK70_02550 [Myxococcales bacterium]|nr:hypothetical protein [Myxococcales bacterium]